LSRKDFAQDRLFATFVPRQLFEADNGGIVQMLDDFSSLCCPMGPGTALHYPILCYAEKRRLGKGSSGDSFAAVFQEARTPGSIDGRPEGAIDATDLKRGHADLRQARSVSERGTKKTGSIQRHMEPVVQ